MILVWEKIKWYSKSKECRFGVTAMEKGEKEPAMCTDLIKKC